MTRIRNATQVESALREIGIRYRFLYRDLSAMREQFAARTSATPAERDTAVALEAHERAFRIDGILEALNWHVRSVSGAPTPNVLPEAPLRGADGEVKFLDYLGYERSTAPAERAGEASIPRPLLAVEAKRTSATLDALRELARARDALALSREIAKLLRNANPAGAFREWLTQTAGYVQILEARAPGSLRRLVLTNGDWLIVFLEPAELFLGATQADPAKIVVFQSFAELMQRSGELFDALEHHSLVGGVPEIEPAEIAAYVDPSRVSHALRGVCVVYQHHRNAFLQPVPHMQIAPTIFLQTHEGGTLRVVVPPADFSMPERASRAHHFRDMASAANRLLSDVERQLGFELTVRTLTEQYLDPGAFEALPGVSLERSEAEEERYFITTGDGNHFLREKPTVPSCPYHTWGKCDRAGRAHGTAAVARPSVQPRAFFVSGEPHHCSHSEVFAAKQQPVTATNAQRCGARSWGLAHAFCEIAPLDSMVCCRTCCFEDVCTNCRTVFKLPCLRGAPRARASSRAASPRPRKKTSPRPRRRSARSR